MKKKWIIIISLYLLCLCLGLFQSIAVADIILPPHSYWWYSFERPRNSNWRTSWNWADLKGWHFGFAPFGNDDGHLGADFKYNTYWPSDWTKHNDDLWVKRRINLSGYDLSSVHWYIGVDNGFKLYLNGTDIGGRWDDGYTYRWEYSGLFLSRLLQPGWNTVALALDDGGWATAFDMMITADKLPPPPPSDSTVPELNSLFLFIIGIASMVCLRVRQCV